MNTKYTFKILLVIAGLLLFINAQAQEFSAVYNGTTIYYKITSSNSVEVTAKPIPGKEKEYYISCYSGNVVIPNTIVYNGTIFNVTSIDNFAFFGCEDLTSITIPANITSIANDFISDGGYKGHESGLQEIIVSEQNQYYTAIDGVLFNKSKSIVICFPPQKATAYYTIPNSVTHIGRSAFYKCTRLTNIIIPSSITHIGFGAFSYCTNLTNIIIPNSVKSISEFAFQGCVGLINVDIPEGITKIECGIFANCTALRRVGIPNCVTYIDKSAFAECINLINIIIPNNVEVIEWRAFYKCMGLTDINIPNSATKVENSAFEGCFLQKITIANTIYNVMLLI